MCIASCVNYIAYKTKRFEFPSGDSELSPELYPSSESLIVLLSLFFGTTENLPTSYLRNIHDHVICHKI
jgi:hypothetical protein